MKSTFPACSRLACTRYVSCLLIVLFTLTGWSGAARADASGIRQDDLNASLIHAAGQGDAVSVNLVLGLGANLQATDKAGNNVVLTAVEGGQHRFLRMALDKGVNPDVIGGSGFTPLTAAVMRGAETDVKLLLAAGANPSMKNAVGDTPLHVAARFNRDALAKLLIEAGARVDDVNAQDETALTVAILANSNKVFAPLLAQRPNLELRDKSGRTPLFWAILENRETMALGLVNAGARFDTLSEGYTPLRMAKILQLTSVENALKDRGAIR